MSLAQTGQLDGARQVCYDALQTDPENADAWHVLGMTLHLAGEAQTAIEAFEKATQFSVPSAALLTNLGVAQAALGQQESAVASYRHALRLQADLAETHNNLANSLQSLGQLDEAIQEYESAIRLRPGYDEPLNHLGTIYEQRREYESAHVFYERALAANPRSVSTLNNLGSLLARQEKNAEAIECFRLALQLDPQSAATFSNLAFVFAKQGNHSEVLDLLRTAKQIDPAYTSNYLFMLGKDPSVSASQLLQEHQVWGQTVESKITPCQHPATQDPERRLRIGYVSPDLRKHVVAQYIEPVLRNHDHQKFEVFCYAEVPCPDAVTDRLQQYVDHWRSTCGRNDDEVVRQIRQDRIDVLIDLAGHTAHNRITVFAHQPAPLQMAWMGYPNTTGLTRIQYRLTCPYQDPAGAEDLHTEQLVRLPAGSACFVPPVDAPEVGPLPALRNPSITFGSLHRLDKLTSATIDRWSSVLNAVEHSRLLIFWPTLHGDRRQWLQEEFIARGVAPERLDLRHECGAGGYMSLYNEIDIGLDPTPWTGSTTTKEALWMGVVVSALYGKRRSSRGSAVLLHQLGLEALVAQTEQQYVDMTRKIAEDIPRLSELRGSMRRRMREHLPDPKSFTESVETAVRALWRRHCG